MKNIINEYPEEVRANVVAIYERENDPSRAYVEVSLVKRQFDAASVTKETFIDMLREDMLLANTRSTAIDDYYYHARVSIERPKFIEAEMAKRLEKINRRYSRPQTIQKYTDIAVAEVNEAADKQFEKRWSNSVTYADFKPSHLDNSIPCDCIISISKLDDLSLERCYNITMERNRYWENAIGWEIIYEGSGKSLRNAFRPEIRLTLCKGHENDMINDSNMLCNAINEFYKNSPVD